MSLLSHLQRWLSGTPARAPGNLPDATWAKIERALPFLDYLPGEARPRLRAMALAFLAEKEFYGAQDFELNDEILLSIALQASLPVLNLGLSHYRHWVGVVVYPGDFLVERDVRDEFGVVHKTAETHLGEAWQGGPVIVSWQPQHLGHGSNVVIHEFAHALDMANGVADGFPPLRTDMSRTQWSRSFNTAYDSLCRHLDLGLPTAIDPYAAENPAEFFAVASEAFFETPLTLRASYPAVYAEMVLLYDLDPAAGAAALEPSEWR